MIQRIEDPCLYCKKRTEHKFEKKVGVINVICCECKKIVEQIFEEDEDEIEFKNKYSERGY